MDTASDKAQAEQVAAQFEGLGSIELTGFHHGDGTEGHEVDLRAPDDTAKDTDSAVAVHGRGDAGFSRGGDTYIVIAGGGASDQLQLGQGGDGLGRTLGQGGEAHSAIGNAVANLQQVNGGRAGLDDALWDERTERRLGKGGLHPVGL